MAQFRILQYCYRLLGYLARKFFLAEFRPDVQNILEIYFDFLDVYPKNVDEIIAGLKLPAQKINELLLRLELAGFISVLPGRLYQKKENHKRDHA